MAEAARLVDRYSVATNGGDLDASAREVLVLVPLGAPVAAGFERARTLLATGARVRLIAHGVTIASTWPAWARGADGLVVAELAAYRPRDLAAATQTQRAVYRAWLDHVFGGLFPGLRGSDVFFGGACLRLFQSAITAVPIAVGVATRHPGATVHLTADWAGATVLAHALEATGGRALGGPATSTRRAPWALALGAGTASCWAATVVAKAREFAASRASRRALAARRDDAVDPDVWLVLVADWERFNRHLIHALALPALANGRRVGVLLFGTLAAGARSEHAQGKRDGDELWPGLGELRARLAELAVGQVVGPESWGACANVLARATRRSAVATWRVAAAGAIVGAGPSRVDLAPAFLAVAKLLTMDVARACAAEHATRRLLDERVFRGKDVIFATASYPEATTADLLLQGAGARSMEYFHGSLGFGEIGIGESRCQARCVWTDADARVSEGAGQTRVVAGMPPRDDLPARPPGAPRRVLIMSNYAHRDLRTASGFPHEPYLEELLRSEAILRDVLGDDVDVRWRPHPAEDAATLDRVSAVHPRVQRTVGTSLDEDVAASDLVITSHSTALYEVLFAGVPVFVHIGPEHEGTPAADYLAPDRTFFWANELRAGLARCAAALARGDDAALAPERAARRALWPPDGSPKPLLAALSPPVGA